VDRARHDLLAGSGFADEEHADVGARGAPERVEIRRHRRRQRPEPHRIAPDVERVEVARGLLGGLREGADGQEDVPDLQEIAGGDGLARDPLAVQVGAVARSGVLERPAGRPAPQPRVEPRQQRGGEPERHPAALAGELDSRRAPIAATDADLVDPVEREPRAARERPRPF